MNIKKKFESIDQSQLNQSQKEILGKIKTATKDFTITDEKALQKVDGALDNIITKLKATNPQAIKGEAKKEEPKAKREVVKKQPKSETKKPKKEKKEAGGKRTIFSIAKEIRKADESWEDAKARAKKVMEKEKEDTTKKMKTETDKLLAFIKRRKELEGLSGTSIKKDSKVQALPKGKRVSKKGWKNQYGESEGGRVYYENRDNRTDRLAPKFEDKIYLENGGGTKGYVEITNPQKQLFDKGYRIYGGDSWETLQDLKKSYSGRSLPKDAMIVKVKGGKVDYFAIAEKERIYEGGGYVVIAKSEKGGGFVMSKPSTKAKAEKLKSMLTKIDGETNEVMTVAKASKLNGLVGKEYLKYADGGTIIGTPETPLARGLDMDYTTLVGETGAMSSGEMFAGGGKVKQNDFTFLKKYPNIEYIINKSDNSLVVLIQEKGNEKSFSEIVKTKNSDDSYVINSVSGSIYKPSKAIGSRWYGDNKYNFDNVVLRIKKMYKLSEPTNKISTTTKTIGDFLYNLENYQPLIEFAKENNIYNKVSFTSKNFEYNDAKLPARKYYNVKSSLQPVFWEGAIAKILGDDSLGLRGLTNFGTVIGVKSTGNYGTENGFNDLGNQYLIDLDLGLKLLDDSNWISVSNGGNGYYDYLKIDSKFIPELEKNSSENIKKIIAILKRKINLYKKYEQGGSLVDGYLTDPNFGDFQAGIYAEGGGVGDVSVIYVDDYPYYIKKMGDSTHFRMANSKDGVDLVIPSHILQHRGEIYYEDVRSWLKGGANPNGKKYMSNGRYAIGGSLGNHGLKQGDQIIKTMSGGVQKVKTRTGDIVYVNLANGYRGAEPPLPFDNGGGIIYKDLFEDYTNQPDELREIVSSYMDKFEEDDYDYEDSKKFLAEVEAVGYTFDYGLDNEPYALRPIGVKLSQVEGYEDSEDDEDGYFDKGGRTRERKYVNYSQKHEVRYSKDKPHRRGYGYAKGGQTVDAFQMRMVKGVDNKPDEVLTTEQEVQFAKGGGVPMNYDGYVPTYQIVKIHTKDGKVFENVYSDSEVLSGIYYSDKPLRSKEPKNKNQMELFKKGGLPKTSFYIPRYNIDFIETDYDGNIQGNHIYGGVWIDMKKQFRLVEEAKKQGRFKAGGKTTFKEKATAIAKNFEGKKVEPKYQKEYGKVYDKAEAKEVGNKIAGSQKAKYDSKMSGGGSTKTKTKTASNNTMVLAKQIRKDGESWQSALKRAKEQLAKK